MTSTPNRGGRPPVDPNDPAPSVSVHVKLPARLYDKSYAEARRQRLSVPEFIRQAVRVATLKGSGR
jgi:hypothetical protein